MASEEISSHPPALRFEPLPYNEWLPTKETLHLWCQIVGKVRMGIHPKLNHWWHVTLYVSPRGLTTGTIPYGGMNFDIEFDFIEHQLQIRTSQGGARRFALASLSVAGFYDALFENLAALGIGAHILARPYETKSKIPFPQDQQHHAYEKRWVERYWRTLVQLDGILKEFSGRFLGKQTPVQLFWHSFDLAQTRFSGEATSPMTQGTVSDREAYSHDVISFGFWPGDDTSPDPAFYSYTYPEPAGLAQEPLSPASAFWVERNGSHLAILPYAALLEAEDPKAIVLGFLESAYRAGSRLAHWPTNDLAAKRTA